MKLKFLVDQNVSSATTKFLRKLNLEVEDVRDVGLKGRPDEEVYEYAKRNNLIIITFDHEFAFNFINKKDLEGLIILRIHPQILESVNIHLKEFFEKAKDETIKKRIVIIEKGRFRIRKLF
ncbi:DUF5615 family PIN-like protein [Candidatus Woesearchaeota archaeon]|nr:DUF5615 family PIN-like protein [Candidatus Woesearchaeota archaeon]